MNGICICLVLTVRAVVFCNDRKEAYVQSSFTSAEIMNTRIVTSSTTYQWFFKIPDNRKEGVQELPKNLHNFLFTRSVVQQRLRYDDIIYSPNKQPSGYLFDR